MSLRPRERDDVVDGEEVGLVAELSDQRELVLDQLADVAGNAVAIAPRKSFLGQLAQVRRRRFVRRHDFLGILVAQLVERKCAAPRDRGRLGEQCGRIDRREPRARAQMALAVGEERVAAFGERLLQPDRGERVLQRAPRADVHVDVAGGDLRQPARLRQARRSVRAARGRRRGLRARRRSRRDRGRSWRPSVQWRARRHRGGLALSRRDIRRHPQREETRRK